MMKNLFYFLQSVFSFFLYPLSAVLVFLFFLFANTNYYVRLISRLQLIPNYIESIQEKQNYALSEELENDDVILTAKQNTEKQQKDILLLREYLEKLSQEKELTALQTKREELHALTFEYAPSNFPDQESFAKAKEEQLSQLDEHIKQIKQQQRKNQKEIRIVKRDIKKQLRDFQKTEKIITERQTDIRKKFASQENTISGKLHKDLNKLSNEYNKTFNQLIVEQTFRKNIDRYLKFFTNYQSDLEQNLIYNANLQNEFLDNRVVRFPPIEINFLAEAEHNGVMQKRHIFREILLEQTQAHKDLENPMLLKTILRNLDSALVANIISKKLKKYNFSFDGDTLKNRRPIEVSGSTARQIEKDIKILSYLYAYRYFLIVIPLLILLALFLAKVSRSYKRKSILTILLVPSFILIIFSVFAMFFTHQILLLFPTLANNIFFLNFSDRLLTAAFRETFFPVFLFFSAHFVIGIIFYYSKIWKKKLPKSQETSAKENN